MPVDARVVDLPLAHGVVLTNLVRAVDLGSAREEDLAGRQDHRADERADRRRSAPVPLECRLPLGGGGLEVDTERGLAAEEQDSRPVRLLMQQWQQHRRVAGEAAAQVDGVVGRGTGDKIYHLPTRERREVGPVDPVLPTHGAGEEDASVGQQVRALVVVQDLAGRRRDLVVGRRVGGEEEPLVRARDVALRRVVAVAVVGRRSWVLLTLVGVPTDGEDGPVAECGECWVPAPARLVVLRGVGPQRRGHAPDAGAWREDRAPPLAAPGHPAVRVHRILRRRSRDLERVRRIQLQMPSSYEQAPVGEEGVAAAEGVRSVQRRQVGQGLPVRRLRRRRRREDLRLRRRIRVLVDSRVVHAAAEVDDLPVSAGGEQRRVNGEDPRVRDEDRVPSHVYTPAPRVRRGAPLERLGRSIRLIRRVRCGCGCAAGLAGSLGPCTEHPTRGIGRLATPVSRERRS